MYSKYPVRELNLAVKTQLPILMYSDLSLHVWQYAYKGVEIWSRTLSGQSVAVVLFNRNSHETKEITAYFALVCV